MEISKCVDIADERHWVTRKPWDKMVFKKDFQKEGCPKVGWMVAVTVDKKAVSMAGLMGLQWVVLMVELMVALMVGSKAAQLAVLMAASMVVLMVGWWVAPMVVLKADLMADSKEYCWVDL